MFGFSRYEFRTYFHSVSVKGMIQQAYLGVVLWYIKHTYFSLPQIRLKIEPPFLRKV